MQRLNVVVICFILVIVGCHCVVITDLVTNSSASYISVAFNPKSTQTRYAVQNSVAGALIYYEASICQKIEQDVANKVVLFQDGQCDYLVAANNLINSQALAGLYFATVFREAGWFLTSDKKIEAVDYPLFEISREDAFIIIEQLASNSSESGFTTPNYSATITEDANLWQAAFNHGAFWFFWLFFFAIVGFSIAFALYKFIAIVRIRGVNFRAGSPGSVPQTNLVLILACFLLLWATNIDPFYSRRLYTYQESESVAGFPLPILLVSCIFTATYWLQLTSKFFYAARWVTRYKLVFWLAATGICALYLILVFLRAFYVLDTAASFIIAFLFEVAVIIFYIVVGIRVIRRLQGDTATNQARVISDKKKQVILKVTRAILLCSGGLALHAIAALIFLAVNFSTAFRNPIAQITILYTFPYAIMLTANAQTYAIQVPTSKYSSKSATGKTGGGHSNSIGGSQMTPRVSNM